MQKLCPAILNMSKPVKFFNINQFKSVKELIAFLKPYSKGNFRVKSFGAGEMIEEVDLNTLDEYAEFSTLDYKNMAEYFENRKKCDTVPKNYSGEE